MGKYLEWKIFFYGERTKKIFAALKKAQNSGGFRMAITTLVLDQFTQVYLFLKEESAFYQFE